MKIINVIIAVSGLLFFHLVLASEIEVINEALESEINTNQPTNESQNIMDTSAEIKVTQDEERGKLSPEIIKAKPTNDETKEEVKVEPEDGWSLMAQLLETKKRNEAEIKAQINELSIENKELNIVVEENLETLGNQKKSIGSLELQLNNLQTSAAQIDKELAVMQENTDTVSYEFKKIKFKNTTSKLTPFLYAASAVLISNQLDASQDSKLIFALAAYSAGTLLESTDYGLSFQLTKLVYKK